MGAPEGTGSGSEIGITADNHPRIKGIRGRQSQKLTGDGDVGLLLLVGGVKGAATRAPDIANLESGEVSVDAIGGEGADVSAMTLQLAGVFGLMMMSVSAEIVDGSEPGTRVDQVQAAPKQRGQVQPLHGGAGQVARGAGERVVQIEAID